MRALIGRIEQWIRHNFPDSDGCERTLGLAEEAGEVCRAVLKLEQGIRGTREQWLDEIEKELGDVFIKLVDIAQHYEIDLLSVIETRWGHDLAARLAGRQDRPRNRRCGMSEDGKRWLIQDGDTTHLAARGEDRIACRRGLYFGERRLGLSGEVTCPECSVRLILERT